ncbi:MAG: hypothetical protein AB1724_15520 [Thermodesulfobacteriota bacterium]
MTAESALALDGLRHLSALKWYVIPLLAMVLYIYVLEIKKARETGNWDAVFAGLTLFGTDFLFETINGWIFRFSRYSALWTTPGETALRTMVGWNIEIMFMFMIAGIIYTHTLSGDKTARILAVPEKFFWVVGYAVLCVFVEGLLNMGGHLVWSYKFWSLTPTGVLPIFCAYFFLFLSPMLVISLKTIRTRILYSGAIYAAAVVMNIFAFGVMNWQY